MTTELITSMEEYNKRVVVGVPATGLLRVEWVVARHNVIIPCNWSQGNLMQSSLHEIIPLRFSVANARNIIAKKALDEKYEWLIFIDHDVLIPNSTFTIFNSHMLEKENPIVNGLYFTRSNPSEPLIYRGLGNSYYPKWKFGEKVYADGAGLGCTLIHMSLIKTLAEEVDEYVIDGVKVKRIFHTPSEGFFDSKTGAWSIMTGTEDLHFYHRLKSMGIYEKAGWKEVQKRKYPLLIDTNIFCGHIDQSGKIYPMFGEDQKFVPKK